MRVLVINSGSSSLKYQVRDTGTNEVAATGLIDRIGEDAGGPADHAEAMEQVAAALAGELADKPLDAVGHRVVHGGERFSEPVLINNEITRSIERLNPLAPLHNPANVLGIRAITAKWPDMPQVAVFDTAFHRTLPEHAWRYAVPDELYRQYGIRRYGFHGTSHEFVTARAAELLGVPLAGFNAVVAHLGNGVSLTAIQGGASIDTSMGFTPLEGLVMGTRSGDIDPSILIFLQRQGLSADEIDTMLNRDSGLKALFGDNDMRTIVDAAAAGDRRAQTAAGHHLVPAGEVHWRLPRGGGRDARTRVHGRHWREFRRVPRAGCCPAGCTWREARRRSEPRAVGCAPGDQRPGFTDSGARGSHRRGAGHRGGDGRRRALLVVTLP